MQELGITGGKKTGVDPLDQHRGGTLWYKGCGGLLDCFRKGIRSLKL